MSKLSRLYDDLEQKVVGKVTPHWAKPVRDYPRIAVYVAVALAVVILLQWGWIALR